MDPESAVLASTAAATMVTLLTTDAWGQVKKEIAGLWRRFRPEHADMVEDDLGAAREEALAAARTGDDAVADALTTEWAARLRRLVAADSAATSELARIAALLIAAQTTAKQPENVTIHQDASASGHSTVIQIAGDGRIG